MFLEDYAKTHNASSRAVSEDEVEEWLADPTAPQDWTHEEASQSAAQDPRVGIALGDTIGKTSPGVDKTVKLELTESERAEHSIDMGDLNNQGLSIDAEDTAEIQEFISSAGEGGQGQVSTPDRSVNLAEGGAHHLFAFPAYVNDAG